MGNLWLKIKIWTKVIAFALLTLAVLIFLVQNINKSVTLWLWNDIETTLLKVVFFTALISVLFTVLLGTTFRTVRQIRELRSRNRSDKLEREVADMRAKAAMLHTKPVPGAAAASLEDAAPRVDDAQEPPPKA